MEPPASRFTTARDAQPAADLAVLAEARSGDEWVTRHVATNGVITVAYQQISVGKHREGRTVDVRARSETLESQGRQRTDQNRRPHQERSHPQKAGSRPLTKSDPKVSRINR